MQTWEIEFEDGTTWRGDAYSGTSAMFKAEVWKMKADKSTFGVVAVTSCREVCVAQEVCN